MMLAVEPLTVEDCAPSAGPSPGESALRALVRAFGRVERVMQPHFARYGLSGAQWGVLRALHRAHADGLDGLRLTDLSERLLVRPPSVTGVVARLERAGLLVREASAVDHRAKQVRLTSAGHELLDRMLEVHGQQVERMMGGLGAAGCGQLQQLLEQLDDHLAGLLNKGTAKPPMQHAAPPR